MIKAKPIKICPECGTGLDLDKKTLSREFACPNCQMVINPNYIDFRFDVDKVLVERKEWQAEIDKLEAEKKKLAKDLVRITSELWSIRNLNHNWQGRDRLLQSEKELRTIIAKFERGG